jgi:hypothetical protein
MGPTHGLREDSAQCRSLDVIRCTVALRKLVEDGVPDLWDVIDGIMDVSKTPE